MDKNIIIRTLTESEYNVLDDFLYEAIFVPEGCEAPPKDIINLPELQVYVEDFGSRSSDVAIAAEYKGEIVGAVWCRIMNDYGHVDDDTPSLAISVIKEHRRHGNGKAMLREMLFELKRKGFRQVSLAVQKENYAVDMYIKAGFVTIDETDEEYIMLRKL